MKGPSSAVSSRRKSGATRLLWSLFGACLVAAVIGYKPVVIVHGLFDSSGEFVELLRFINQSHPGTNVSVFDLFDRSSSLQPLWKQVEGFKAAIYPVMQNAADGVHFICYSQGLIAGQYGGKRSLEAINLIFVLNSQHHYTDYLKYLFPQFMKSNLFHFCYTSVGQRISICNFWKDPHHMDMYVNGSDYLALLNSERPNPNSTDDGVITPWQSSQFGFYNDNETVVEIKDQDLYLRDVFGLKTLNARGDLFLCSMAGVEHINWHSNYTVFNTCIEKWLV
ncbi:unnamed protein product [Coregonus sp. 'balchen']|nr:unnamed protein product [Coregonus sp. 'balchen']